MVSAAEVVVWRQSLDPRRQRGEGREQNIDNRCSRSTDNKSSGAQLLLPVRQNTDAERSSACSGFAFWCVVRHTSPSKASLLETDLWILQTVALSVKAPAVIIAG